ncbi:MAG: ribosome assembly RNA-binding protein YhbY [Christensenellaceae bacterium]|nr:ribosome assembly RNA-binding protein YhbY [Christensenellaceae bacterium]
MTSQQRAKLRSMANTMEPIVHIGKEGLGENLLTQVDEALEARELIKGTVQKNCDEPVREVAHALAEAVGAECVQVIGRRFVLYRPSEKDPRIVL